MIRAFSLSLFAATFAGVLPAQQETAAPESLKEKASYVMGRDLMKDFRERLIEIDVEQFVAGMRSAAAGKPSILTDEDVKSVMSAFGRDLEKRQQEKLREVADKNMRDGEAFRKENSLKDGVKQLENGLQYEILEKGHGESPGIEDHVKVHFVGKTIDGKIFESTREESQAPTLPVGAFGVRGIVEALLRMKPGSKWQLVIPPDLAYGVDGAMPEIEPNQTLIFEVELLEVVKQ